MTRIAVIGAGISGLSCAHELTNAGFNVQVFEKESFVGGRMSTRIKNGYHFDIGADHLCNVYKELIQYCKKNSIIWEKMRFLKYVIFRDGKLHPLLQSLSVISRIRLLLFTIFLKNKQVDFLDLSTAKELDTESAYEFMKRKTGTEVATYTVDPFTSTYEFHGASQISKAVLLSFMQSVKYNPKDWYLHRTKGGMSAIPESLAKHVQVRLNSQVISVEQKRAHVKIISTDTKGKRNKKEKFDYVVCACTAEITKNILKNPTSEQKNLLESTRYSSTISIAFTIPRGLLTSTIHMVPYAQSNIISGYVNEEMKGPDCIKGNKTLLCAWLHHTAARELLNKNDEAIFRTVKKELARVCPVIDVALIQNHDLQRWETAMPIYYTGYVKKVAAFLEKQENNIFFCGDYLNSPWTEGAFRCGKRVAQKIISIAK